MRIKLSLKLLDIPHPPDRVERLRNRLPLLMMWASHAEFPQFLNELLCRLRALLSDFHQKIILLRQYLGTSKANRGVAAGETETALQIEEVFGGFFQVLVFRQSAMIIQFFAHNQGFRAEVYDLDDVARKAEG